MMNAINLLRPSRTVVTSLNPRQTCNSLAGDGDWVMNMAVSPTSIACSLSNGQVQIYDRNTMKVLSTTQPSSVTTPEVQYTVDGNVLYLAHYDGCLSTWDLRVSESQRQSKQLSPSASLQSLALGFDDTILAAGTSSGRIIFYDSRHSTTLGSYVDSHKGSVTSLCFQGSKLASGAEDGLMNCFDCTQPTEEMATLAICNVGAGLRKVGFCGASSEAFALTGSETASIWSVSKGTCAHHYGDLRQLLSVQMGKEVDYLIDAQWEAATNTLVMAVGTNMGNGAVFHLTEQGQWRPRQLFSAGHVGIIRSWKPLDGQSFLSAGEDARIVEWRSQITMAPSPIPIMPSSEMVRGPESNTFFNEQRPKRLKVSSSRG